MGEKLNEVAGPDVAAAAATFLAGLKESVREAVAEAVREERRMFVEAGPGLARRLGEVNAKVNVTVPEAALLLGCSDGHVRNLVRRAKKCEERAPVPFRDLDGVVVFKLDELLAWSEKPKGGLKALPARHGADTLAALPAGPRLPKRSDAR